MAPSASARWVRKILAAHGIVVGLGKPGPERPVLAWGHSPRARRAEWAARVWGAPLWRVEDAWLRSLYPGRLGQEPPYGLLLDRMGGAHYDPSEPSELETLLATDPLDSPALLARAQEAMARLRICQLSKYNAFDPTRAPPRPGFVLVIDQVRGDASLRCGGYGPADFAALLERALAEHPGRRVVIRTHPEAQGGARRGHFGPEHARDRVELCTAWVSPWALLEAAEAVYTVSSQLGFEAILAGHRPVVTGMPFYAGWGLTDDSGHPRRGRKLTAAQLFAGAAILYPLWYDPLRDTSCTLEAVIDQLEAQVRAFREDRTGWVATAVRAWKRRHIQQFFGAVRPVCFVADPVRAAQVAKAKDHRLMGWASALPQEFPGVRVEDGFLRSRGLGAKLVPPIALVLDDLGIYYDPTRESRLERLIMGPLPPGALARARTLREMIVKTGLTKYNLGKAGQHALAALLALKAQRPGAKVVLVPGQVEDDASIRFGATGSIRSNRALLQAARDAFPQALIVYKPHPDVEAGLRPGALSEAAHMADLVLEGVDPVQLFPLVDRVVTITSGLGFEALLRALPVTVFGVPFYAGWGLTDDRVPTPPRRVVLPQEEALDRLVYAALIAYPRYRDPLTGLACPAELAAERLASGTVSGQRLSLRALAKLQGWFAAYSWLWRWG